MRDTDPYDWEWDSNGTTWLDPWGQVETDESITIQLSTAVALSDGSTLLCGVTQLGVWTATVPTITDLLTDDDTATNPVELIHLTASGLVTSTLYARVFLGPTADPVPWLVVSNRDGGGTLTLDASIEDPTNMDAGPDTQGIWLWRTGDDGATWDLVSEVWYHDNGGTDYNTGFLQNWKVSGTLTDALDTGTALVIAGGYRYTDATDAYWGAFYSTDDGATWTRGTQRFTSLRGFQGSTHLSWYDGNLRWQSRAPNILGQVGRYMKSTDDGSTWTDIDTWSQNADNDGRHFHIGFEITGGDYRGMDAQGWGWGNTSTADWDWENLETGQTDTVDSSPAGTGSLLHLCRLDWVGTRCETLWHEKYVLGGTPPNFGSAFDPPALHIPYKRWLETGEVAMLQENWLTVERWSRDFLSRDSYRSCGGVNGTTAAPTAGVFHTPDPLAQSERGRYENWLAVERWVASVLPAYLCHHCTSVTAYWTGACELHIPAPVPHSVDDEHANWLELERWVVRLKNCGCTGSFPPPS